MALALLALLVEAATIGVGKLIAVCSLVAGRLRISGEADMWRGLEEDVVG